MRIRRNYSDTYKWFTMVFRLTIFWTTTRNPSKVLGPPCIRVPLRFSNWIGVFTFIFSFCIASAYIRRYSMKNDEVEKFSLEIISSIVSSCIAESWLWPVQEDLVWSLHQHHKMYRMSRGRFPSCPIHVWNFLCCWTSLTNPQVRMSSLFVDVAAEFQLLMSRWHVWW